MPLVETLPLNVQFSKLSVGIVALMLPIKPPTYPVLLVSLIAEVTVVPVTSILVVRGLLISPIRPAIYPAEPLMDSLVTEQSVIIMLTPFVPASAEEGSAPPTRPATELPVPVILPETSTPSRVSVVKIRA